MLICWHKGALTAPVMIDPEVHVESEPLVSTLAGVARSQTAVLSQPNPFTKREPKMGATCVNNTFCGCLRCIGTLVSRILVVRRKLSFEQLTEINRLFWLSYCSANFFKSFQDNVLMLEETDAPRHFRWAEHRTAKPIYA